MKVFYRAAMLVGFPAEMALLFLAEFSNMDAAGISLVLKMSPPILWLAFWILLHGLLWNLPVRCPTPGCHDTLKKSKTVDLGKKDQIEYRCEICSQLIEFLI